MPGCCRTLAHHSQVMVMPRFSAQRSSGPGSLLEVLHIMRFLGVPLTSQFCLQMLEHPRVSGSQLGDGPVASLGRLTRWLPQLSPMWHQR